MAPLPPVDYVVDYPECGVLETPEVYVVPAPEPETVVIRYMLKTLFTELLTSRAAKLSSVKQ